MTEIADGAIERIFERADLNGDGVVRYNELKAVLQILDPKMWDDMRVHALLAAIDFDMDGAIRCGDLLEFLSDKPQHSLFELAGDLKIVDMYFEPGELGVNTSPDIGYVSTVDDGQCKELGVQPGWVICRIDDEAYAEGLLDEKKKGSKSYTIAFMVPFNGSDVERRVQDMPYQETSTQHVPNSAAETVANLPSDRQLNVRPDLSRRGAGERVVPGRRPSPKAVSRRNNSPSAHARRSNSQSPRARSMSPRADGSRSPGLPPPSGWSPRRGLPVHVVNSTETSQEQVICASDPHKAHIDAKLEANQAERAAKRAAIQDQLRRAEEEKERAAQMVMEYVVELGEHADFAEAVVSDMTNRKTLLKAIAGTEIESAYIAKGILRARRKQFQTKFDDHFPWKITSLQQKEVIDRILRGLSSELSELRPDEDLRCYADALNSALLDKCDLFICPICYDDMISIKNGMADASNMWFATEKKTEHWTNRPCGHACCRDCMRSWVETSIKDQKANVTCPAPACSYALWDYDIQSLVDPDVFQMHQEHKHANYLHHLKDLMKQDASLKNWLKSNARPCPDCHVIVSRYEGCNQMQCVCGTRFCYDCGFKACRCGSRKKRPNIWNPKS